MALSGKLTGEWAAPSFKTLREHKTLRALLPFRSTRPEGYRKSPVRVTLPAETAAAQEKPTVRIFLGTEPAQYRAERIFVWSIEQVRDRSRRYEIYLMKDLADFDRRGWKTGFSHYRYAIPALAGGCGRAIYNDVDQIYLSDPGELFDMDMGQAAIMGITEKETSVMLLDCGKMAELWKLQDVQRATKHKPFRAAAQQRGLWGTLPAEWNARDHEFVPGQSKLLHFTTLHRQPWHPFPKDLKYQPHEQAKLWLDMEHAADDAGFYLFSKDRPSDRYGELLDFYKTMHVEGFHKEEAGKGVQRTGKPEKTFVGKSLKEHIPHIAELVRKTGATTILDYGSGKASLYHNHPDKAPGSRYKRIPEWSGVTVTCYDPGYQPFAEPYEAHYDGVITTDVLEHIPEEDIAWVLDELFAHAERFVYAVAACYPAKKLLPDGTNAHCTLQEPEWWQGQMRQVGRRYPDVHWMLCTQEHSILSLNQRRRLMNKGVRDRFFRGKGNDARE